MNELDGQMSWLDLDLDYGKTSPEHSVPTKAKTSEPSLKSSAKLKTVTPLFLDLRKESGLTQGLSWETGIQLRGESLMLNFGAYPSAVEESFLSQILVEKAPEKYYLSARACQGILNRASKRGKELPEVLRIALERGAASNNS